MKKLVKWLSEHAAVLGSGEKDSILHLWCILISFVIILVFAICGWTGKAMEWLLGILLLGGTFVPPVFAGIISWIKKTPCTPWYWFPIIIGFVIGGLLAMFVCFVFSIV